MIFVFIFFLTQLFFLFKNEDTALHIAALSGSEQIVKILLEHGSNVHLQDKVLIFFFFVFFLISLFVYCGLCYWLVVSIDCECGCVL